MPIFEYKAYAAGGATKTGVIDADTPREARSRLRKDKILVSELKVVKGGRRKVGEPKKKGSLAEKIQKFRQQQSGGPSGRSCSNSRSRLESRTWTTVERPSSLGKKPVQPAGIAGPDHSNTQRAS